MKSDVDFKLPWVQIATLEAAELEVRQVMARLIRDRSLVDALPETPPAARRAPPSPPKSPLTKEREYVTDYGGTELRNKVQKPREKLNTVVAAHDYHNNCA